MYFIYVLQSEVDQRLCIGFTADLAKYVSNHRRGEVSSTVGRRPLKLIYLHVMEDDSADKASPLDKL